MNALTPLEAKVIGMLVISTVLGVSCVASESAKELIGAAAAGDADQVQYLLTAGADPNGRASDDWTALTVAAREGHIAVVDVLLRSGADIDQVEGGGNSALFWAAWGGNRDVVTLLLDRGADPERRCRECDSPVEIAKKRNHDEIATIIQARRKR